MDSLVCHIILSLVLDLQHQLHLISNFDALEVQPPICAAGEADVNSNIIRLGRDLDGLHMHESHHLLHIRYFNLEVLFGVIHWLGCSEVYAQGEFAERLDNSVVLAEAKFISKLLLATQFPSHRDEGLVEHTKYCCLLSMEQDFLKLDQLLLQFDLWLCSMCDYVEILWPWVVLYTEHNSVFYFTYILRVGPDI